MNRTKFFVILAIIAFVIAYLVQASRNTEVRENADTSRNCLLHLNEWEEYTLGTRTDGIIPGDPVPLWQMSVDRVRDRVHSGLDPSGRYQDRYLYFTTTATGGSRAYRVHVNCEGHLLRRAKERTFLPSPPNEDEYTCYNLVEWWHRDDDVRIGATRTVFGDIYGPSAVSQKQLKEIFPSFLELFSHTTRVTVDDMLDVCTPIIVDSPILEVRYE